jgi:hypothetical protein
VWLLAFGPPLPILFPYQVACDLWSHLQQGSGIRKGLRLPTPQSHFQLSGHPVDPVTSDLTSSMHLSWNEVQPKVRPRLQQLLGWKRVSELPVGMVGQDLVEGLALLPVKEECNEAFPFLDWVRGITVGSSYFALYFVYNLHGGPKEVNHRVERWMKQSEWSDPMANCMPKFTFYKHFNPRKMCIAHKLLPHL